MNTRGHDIHIFNSARDVRFYRKQPSRDCDSLIGQLFARL